MNIALKIYAGLVGLSLVVFLLTAFIDMVFDLGDRSFTVMKVTGSFVVGNLILLLVVIITKVIVVI